MHCWNGFLVASCLLLAPGVKSVANQEGSSEIREETEKRPATAKELLERFAKIEGLEVSFSEKKHIALLAVPLESTGRIYFLRPGYLSRIVEAPSKSSLTITPRELRLTNSREERVVDLRQNAELRAFVTSLLHVFAGEREKLEKSYKLLYELDAEDESRWFLTLEPREKPLTEMLQSLRLEGHGAAVASIVMHEPNGDRTVTTVLTNDPERRFTPEEKRLLFGIEAPTKPEKSESGAKSP